MDEAYYTGEHTSEHEEVTGQDSEDKETESEVGKTEEEDRPINVTDEQEKPNSKKLQKVCSAKQQTHSHPAVSSPSHTQKHDHATLPATPDSLLKVLDTGQSPLESPLLPWNVWDALDNEGSNYPYNVVTGYTLSTSTVSVNIGEQACALLVPSDTLHSKPNYKPFVEQYP